MLQIKYIKKIGLILSEWTKNWIEENSKERSTIILNKFNLPDFLIIKNWLIYAKIIDDRYKKVFDIDVKTTHLSKMI